MAKYNIFQFNVPVNYFMLVHVFDSLSDLSNHDGGGLLREGFLFGQEIIEVAVGGEFKQKIDVGLVAEEIIELDKVGMIEIGLEFDFADELV